MRVEGLGLDCEIHRLQYRFMAYKFVEVWATFMSFRSCSFGA